MKKTYLPSHTRTVLSLGALALAFTGGLLLAGPLDPPAGPVTPAYKTLSEVEPRIAVSAANTPGDTDSLFRITQPGSYYLTGDITGVAGKHGVEIAASGVTLDLNGFDLAGVPGMGGFDGVSVTENNLKNIAVVNGSIRSWGRDGMNLGDLFPTNCRVESVSAAGNGRVGIFGGVGSRIVKCAADGNQFGLSAQSNSEFSDCSASNNTSVGLTVPWGSSATNCSAYSNDSGGINAYSGSALLNCSAYQNTGIGIATETNSTVTNCTASQNTFNGIVTGNGCTVTGCTASQNTFNGISTGIGCTVTDCSALTNSNVGISAGDGCTVMNCSAHSNFRGVGTATGCTVSDCTARNNSSDGILCFASCLVRGNTCTLNGGGAGDGAGIHATGSANHIEGNTCTTADRGIDVDVAGNIIVRNTCSGNTTNWDIAAGNSVAPIVQASTNAANISGNTYTGALGSTDPNANFTY